MIDELKTMKTLEANKHKGLKAILDPILHTIVACGLSI